MFWFHSSDFTSYNLYAPKLHIKSSANQKRGFKIENENYTFEPRIYGWEKRRATIGMEVYTPSR